MKTYGRMTTAEIPTMARAIECDLENGSHHMNNMASEKFAKEYCTILAVAQATDKAMENLVKKAWNMLQHQRKHGRTNTTVFRQLEKAIEACPPRRSSTERK